MSSADCDICSGRAKVRLPVYRRAVASYDRGTIQTIEEASREYPCPECSVLVPIERVNAVREETFAASYIDDPKFVDHVKDSLGHQLVDFLLRNDFIQFERGPTDEVQMRWTMRATVGVVSKKRLETLEARIAERQIEVAQEVATEAKEQIGNWASHYGHADILKRDAIRLVGDAIRVVLAKRTAFKALKSA